MQPLWEEQHHTNIELSEQNCVIWLNKFSWERIEIDDGEIVEAKKIVLFAARRLLSVEDIVILDVGYYLDLPGVQEVLFKIKY